VWEHVRGEGFYFGWSSLRPPNLEDE
jgi:hypothetical protein